MSVSHYVASFGPISPLSFCLSIFWMPPAADDRRPHSVVWRDFKIWRSLGLTKRVHQHYKKRVITTTKKCPIVFLQFLPVSHPVSLLLTCLSLSQSHSCVACCHLTLPLGDSCFLVWSVHTNNKKHILWLSSNLVDLCADVLRYPSLRVQPIHPRGNFICVPYNRNQWNVF